MITNNLYFSLNFNLNIMSQPKLPLWIKLTAMPESKLYCRYRILCDRDCRLLIAMPQIIFKTDPTVIFKTDPKPVLFIYFVGSDEWKSYKAQRVLFPGAQRILLPGAINGKKIYTFTNKHEIAMLELIHKTKKCKFEIIKIVNEIYKLDKSAVAIFIKDEFHHISTKHFKYNRNTEELDVMSRPAICYHNNSLIRIKNKLLLFAEYCSKDSQDHELIIQEYDIKNNSWQRHSIKLQEKFMIVSCTSILNEQMVLLCGSENWQDKHKYILMYEVKTKSIKKSNIKFPMSGRNYLYSINDKKMDNLSTNAWIKNECRNVNVCLPECLNRMMTSFFIKESVHVINSLGTHYKIDVFEIINNCSNE